MAHCTSCGAETAPGDAYCHECGTDLTGPDAGDDGRDESDQTAPVTAEVRRAKRTFDQGDDHDDASRSARAADRSGFTTGQKVGFAGVATAAVGAFLPWLSVTALGATATKQGIDGDGSITLVLSLIAGALLFAKYEGNYRWLSVVLGGVVALVALVYINDPLAGATAPSGVAVDVSVGSGVYLTALGGVLLVGGPLYDGASD